MSDRAPAVRGADPSTLRERLVDALHLLDEGGTRWRVIGVTIAFPVVMVLGGALARLDDSLLLRLLAALPALLLLGMVGAFGQFVLTVTLQGHAHADDPPGLAELARRAPRTLQRLGALGGTYLGPGLVVVLLGHWPIGILLMLAGLAMLPFATALLLGTGCWRALSPLVVLSAIRRAGRTTMTDAAVAAAMCVPALLALVLTIGQSPYTMLAVVGPLGATPALLAARMLGLTLCEHRHAFEGVFSLPAVEELTAATTTVPKGSAARPRPKPAPPAARPRPAQPLAARHTPLAARPAAAPQSSAASRSPSAVRTDA